MKGSGRRTALEETYAIQKDTMSRGQRHRQNVKGRTKSVIILLTHAFPVNGNSHCFSIFGRPFLSVCSMVMTTLVAVGLETRSMAPPKPLILPGNIPSKALSVGTSHLAARQLTVCQIPFATNLHGTQYCQINPACSYHAKTLVTAKTSRAR